MTYPEKKKRNYLNYDVVKANHDSEGRHAIMCYYNGITHICPNPHKKEITNFVNENFKYVSKEVYVIDDECFNDEDTWI